MSSPTTTLPGGGTVTRSSTSQPDQYGGTFPAGTPFYTPPIPPANNQNGGAQPAPVGQTASSTAPETPTAQPQSQSTTTVPSTTTPAPTTEEVLKSLGITPTNDPTTNTLLAQLGTSNAEGAVAYSNMVNQVAQLQYGPLVMTPEQQTYVSSMQSSLQSTINTMQQAANASTAVTREALSRSGATQASPQTAASEIALSIQAGANQIQQASANATMQIAQFEMNIRSGDIASAQANYQLYEQYQKDQTDAFQQMYSDINEHNEFAANYGLAVAQYHLSVATLNAKYGGLIDPYTGNLNMGKISQLGLSTTIPGVGNVVDTSSPKFAALEKTDPGAATAILMGLSNNGIQIDSSTDQGKAFLAYSNALQTLNTLLPSSSVRSNVAGTGKVLGFGTAKKIASFLGTDASIPNLANMTVQQATNYVQNQMATAAEVPLSTIQVMPYVNNPTLAASTLQGLVSGNSQNQGIVAAALQINPQASDAALLQAIYNSQNTTNTAPPTVASKIGNEISSGTIFNSPL